MQPRTKNIVALIAAVVVVVAAGLAGSWPTSSVRLRRSCRPSPRTRTRSPPSSSPVSATRRCSARGSKIVELHVPEGYPLQLSLPKEVADSDWRLNVQIGNPKTGEIFEGYRDYKPGEAYAVTVPGNPGEQLISAIIQLPAKGGLAPIWAIQTMPLPGGGVVAPTS
ncbi:DUF2771 family protein [Prescottella defluvii]|nr:DUF2771 family protein [Prescottella defluvii]